MSGFFTWCASLRKPPKENQNGIENQEEEVDEGSEWSGEYETDEEGDAVEMQEDVGASTGPPPEDDVFVRKQKIAQVAVSVADNVALKQLQAMSEVGSDTQGRGQENMGEEEACTAAVAVVVQSSPSPPAASPSSSSETPAVFTSPLFLPLPVHQFFAIVIVGCIASAICSGASSSAGSDTGFAIAIVLAAPQFLGLLTTTAIMPPLLLRVMCAFHMLSIFFSAISVASYGMSTSRVGPAAAASPTIASLLWFLAALATMWCSILTVKQHIHQQKQQKLSRKSQLAAAPAPAPSATAAAAPSAAAAVSTSSPRPASATVFQSCFASVSRGFVYMSRLCSCTVCSMLVMAAMLWLFVQIACAYHASKTAHGQVADAAPGKLYDIGGGISMHMICQGRSSNESSATVILESMEAVGQALAWSAVMEVLQDRDVRVCAYDRRGYGWSSPLPYANSETQNRGIKEIVTELKLLLKASGEKPPYVVAGHSVGAIYARMFAAENPADVAAVLSIDSAVTDIDYWNAARPALTKLSPADLKLCRNFLAPLGIIDLVASQILTRVMNAYLTTPLPNQDKFLRRFVQPSYCLTAGVEIAAYEQAVTAVRSASDKSRKGDMHVLLMRSTTVLGTPSSAKVSGTNKSWKQMQLDLLLGVTKMFPVAEGSSVCADAGCRQMYAIEYNYDTSTMQNTTRYSSGEFVHPNACFNSDMGVLAPVLENSVFSTAPYQSFHIGGDAVKGSWFAGVPKRITVNGAFCYEAWANATYYQEQGNYNALAQYADNGACPACGVRVFNTTSVRAGVCDSSGAVTCNKQTRGFNYRCEAWREGALGNSSVGVREAFSGIWKGHCDQASGAMIATPLNSLTRRIGSAVDGSEAMTFDAPDVISYAVQYTVSLGLGQLPKLNGSQLVEWIDV